MELVEELVGDRLIRHPAKSPDLNRIENVLKEDFVKLKDELARQNEEKFNELERRNEEKFNELERRNEKNFNEMICRNEEILNNLENQLQGLKIQTQENYGFLENKVDESIELISNVKNGIETNFTNLFEELKVIYWSLYYKMV